MTRPMPVIIGPTAVGKTDLSIAIAQHWEAEIVSADSRQIYRYLDIGTAKPTATQRQTVSHHMIDLLNPDEALNAARFVRMAGGCMRTIEARGKRPFIVGGSGLYVRALTDGLFPGPGAHPPLRAALAAEAQALGGQALHERLAQVDPQAAARIHPNDRVRIIRALEIYALTGTPITQWQRQWQDSFPRQGVLLIGLTRTREDLRQRISARTQAMLSQGLEAEVKGLLARGFPPTLPPLQSVGYREMIAYLAGELDLPHAQALIERNTWRLAKRQMTWFRHLAGVYWFSLTDMPEETAVEAIISLLSTGGTRQRGGLSSAQVDTDEVRCTCVVAT